MTEQSLLRIEQLVVSSSAAGGPALGPIDIAVDQRGVVGVVGDSGAGKSLLISALTGSLRSPARITDGRIVFDGMDLVTQDARITRGLRGRRIAFIGSNPHSLLHPMLPVGRQVAQILRTHQKIGKKEARAQVLDMFQAVGIPDPSRRLDAYPHELSGGMAQRVVIAMGLICDPEIILADEPTAGLDVTIQAQVLDLIEQMVRGNGDRGLLLATRDLGIVARFCDRVAILDKGQISEQRSVADFFVSPRSESGAELIRASRGF